MYLSVNMGEHTVYILMYRFKPVLMFACDKLIKEFFVYKMTNEANAIGNWGFTFMSFVRFNQFSFIMVVPVIKKPLKFPLGFQVHIIYVLSNFLTLQSWIAPLQIT